MGLTYVVDNGRYISSIRSKTVCQMVAVFQGNVPAKIIVYFAELDTLAVVGFIPDTISMTKL